MADDLIYPEDTLDISEFLRSSQDLEDEMIVDQVFNEGPLNTSQQINVQPSAAHPSSQSTEPPGVSQPTTMHTDTISPVPTIEETEGTIVTPIEDQHALETVNANELEIFDFWDDKLEDKENTSIFDEDDEDFTRQVEQLIEDKAHQPALNEANMEQAAQPMQQTQTQPPQGVTNMTGGSSGSGGSEPGVKNESNIADRTEGGTTGTTPSSAPMSQGYGVQQTSVNMQTIDTVEGQQGALSPEDRKLVTEFDSLV